MTGIEVMVFDKLKSTTPMEPLGVVNQMTALTWTERVREFGGFELWAPLTEENAYLLQPDHFIWLTGEKSIGIIETIQKTRDSDGGFTMEVTGRFSEKLLALRVIQSRYTNKTNLVTGVRDLVYNNCMVSGNRQIPHFLRGSPQETTGYPTIEFNVHRDNLWDHIQALAETYQFIPYNQFNYEEKKIRFFIRKPVDRTIGGNNSDKVLLSSDLSDILSSDYTLDTTEYQNVAYVAGQGEGEARKEYMSYNTSSIPTGMDRREISVDARDIEDTEPWDMVVVTTKQVTDTHKYLDEETGQKLPYEWKYTTTVTKTLTHPQTGEVRTTVTSSYEWLDEEPEPSTSQETGTEDVPFPIEIYNGMLNVRGIEKLSECPKVESFNAQIRVEGARAYTYGEDYNLGDKVTVEDRDLKIQVDVTITEVERSWDEDNYSIVLTLGIAAPTIKQLIERR